MRTTGFCFPLPCPPPSRNRIWATLRMKGKATIFFRTFCAPALPCPETALTLQVQQYTPHPPLNPPRCMDIHKNKGKNLPPFLLARAVCPEFGPALQVPQYTPQPPPKSPRRTACMWVVFYGCFLVIEARVHGGTWFRTPCPNCRAKPFKVVRTTGLKCFLWD